MTRWGEEKEGAALAGMKLECAFLVSLLALALERVSQRPKPGPDEDVTVFFWGGQGPWITAASATDSGRLRKNRVGQVRCTAS